MASAKAELHIDLDPEVLGCLKTLAEEEFLTAERWAWDNVLRGRIKAYLRPAAFLQKRGWVYQNIQASSNGPANLIRIQLRDLKLQRYTAPEAEGTNLTISIPQGYLEAAAVGVALDARSQELLNAPALQQEGFASLGAWAKNVVTEKVLDSWTRREENLFDEADAETHPPVGKPGSK